MKKRDLILFRIFTGIFSAHMLMTVVAYIAMNQMVSETFESIGVPAAIIYPLAIAKVLGLIAIWSNRSRVLKELAYLGFALDFVLASAAHAVVGDGGAIAPLVALTFLILSYMFQRRLRGQRAAALQQA